MNDWYHHTTVDGTIVQIAPFVDISASVRFGQGCKVWNFTVICQGVEIGDDCVIGSHVYIGRETVIGNNVHIQDGSHITDRMTIGDGVFIGAHVVTGNDRYPKVCNPDYKVEPPTIENGASLGNGCNILPGIIIEACAMVGAGAVVTKNVPSRAVVVGNPARVIRYVEDEDHAGRDV